MWIAEVFLVAEECEVGYADVYTFWDEVCAVEEFETAWANDSGDDTWHGGTEAHAFAYAGAEVGAGFGCCGGEGFVGWEGGG